MASTAPTSRSARYAKSLAVPAGLALSALLIWQASYAAFSSTAANEDNSWSAGTVTITDDDGDQPLFSVENLAPGATESRTVTAQYEGSLDAQVSFYGRNFTEPAADANGTTLADYIVLTVEGNTGPTFGAGPTGTIFRGTLAAFAEMNSFERGLHYDAAGGAPVEQGSFRFTYRVADDAPNSVQGQEVGIDFVAEAQSR